MRGSDIACFYARLRLFLTHLTTQERQRIEDAGGRVDFQRCWRVVVEPRDGRPGSGLAVSRCVCEAVFIIALQTAVFVCVFKHGMVALALAVFKQPCCWRGSVQPANSDTQSAF